MSSRPFGTAPFLQRLRPLLLAALAAAAACRSSGGSDAAARTGGDSAGGAVSGTATAGGSGGGGGTSSGSVGAPPPPLYTGITPLTQSYAFRGRFDMSKPEKPAMEWGNAGIGFRVKGTTQVTASLDNGSNSDPYNWIVVNVDGTDTAKISFTPGVTSYTVASHLSTDEHTIWLSKGQEFGFGAVTFGGVTLDAGGTLMAPPVLPNRRVIFIGSSTMTGWGSDNTVPPLIDPNCTDQVNFPSTNALHSVPRYTADYLNADYWNLSKGAGGIMCTFAQYVTNLPEAYPLTVDDAAKVWDATQWKADVIAIEAGGSDMTLGSDQTPDLATLNQVQCYTPLSQGSNQTLQTRSLDDLYAAYHAFLDLLRKQHPGAGIVLINTKNQSGPSQPILAGLLDRLAASYPDGRVWRFDYFTTDIGAPASLYTDWYDMKGKIGSACEDHPAQANSTYLADRLARFIRQKMSWQ